MTLEEAIAILEQRIERGTTWLQEHDPGSRFHFWYQAGLTDRSPIKAHDADTIAAWRMYYRQRVRWEELNQQLANLERKRNEGTKREHIPQGAEKHRPADARLSATR